MPNPKSLMVDFAHRDPRSANAMLHGHGDGREKPWIQFELTHQDKMSIEDMMDAYMLQCRSHVIIDWQVLYQRTKRLLLFLLSLFVIVS